jgi:hypothetical protein
MRLPALPDGTHQEAARIVFTLQELTEPAARGVSDRWEERQERRTELVAAILASVELLNEGDAHLDVSEELSARWTSGEGGAVAMHTGTIGNPWIFL